MVACAAAKSIFLLHSETLSAFNFIYGYAENSPSVHLRRRVTLAEHGKTNINGHSKLKKKKKKEKKYAIYDANFSLKFEIWNSFKKTIRYELLPITLHRNIFQRV